MASLANKRISQKTFDECVRENVEELEMEKEEALADAIAQFKSQGVDLSNIDTSGADREVEQRATAAAIEMLREAVTTKTGTPDEAKCRIALLDLANACRRDGAGGGDEVSQESSEDAVGASAGEDEVVDDKADGAVGKSDTRSSLAKAVTANQTAIAMAQGPMMLAALLGHEPLAEPTLDCLAAVCFQSVEARDGFPAQGMAILARIIKVQAELQASGASTGDVAGNEANAGKEETSSPVKIATKACNVVYILAHKTENNKQGFVRKESGGLDALLACLTVFGDQNPACVRAACVALRSVCTFDDLRKDFAGAFDAAKAAVKAGFIVELLRLGKRHSGDPDCVASIFFALRAIACNDEAVQQISAGGGLAMAEAQLEAHAAHGGLCRHACALLRNLAGNDSVKTSLCTVRTLNLLLGATLPPSPHAGDPLLAEHVVATLAAMALRVPTNCERILAVGGGRAITGAMRRFPQTVPLQRNCCLAVRNLVGRSPELREKVLEDGMEGLLRHAGTLSGSVDAAFAALRDLGLEVEMVTVDPLTGEVRKGVEMFGEAQSSFRAVYDDDPAKDREREARIAAAAKTPKELGYNM